MELKKIYPQYGQKSQVVGYCLFRKNKTSCGSHLEALSHKLGFEPQTPYNNEHFAITTIAGCVGKEENLSNLFISNAA